MQRSVSRHVAGVCLLLLTLAPAGTRAQDAPRPVAGAQHTETVAAAPPVVPNQTMVNIAAGATINGGNTRSYAGNLGGRLDVIRRPQQFTVEVLGTLAAARNDTTNEIQQTSANVLGRARYDVFLSRMDALFIALQPRRDTFAGLDLRLQMQTGYLRNLFFTSDSHRLWTELGYDLTYDNFATITTTTTTDVTGMVPPGTDLPSTDGGTTRVVIDEINTFRPPNDFVHSARAFLGYTNRIYTAAGFNVGVEFLYDIEDPANIRVNSLAELTSSVTQRFTLGIQARVFYDRVPVPGKDPYDTVVAMQLVYTFDSLAGTPAAPSCPPCDCTAQVQAALGTCAERLQMDEAAAAPEPAASEPAPAAEEPPSA